MSAPRVEVMTRSACHLCEVALQVVAQVCAETGTAWTETDIDADPALRDRWTDMVPVTLVDGRQHDYWRVDAERLRAALTEPPR